MVQPTENRNVRRSRGGAGTGFVAEKFQVLNVRANERDSGFGATAREIRTLREEAVSGMDGVASGRLRRRDQGIGVEICRRAFAGEGIGSVSDASVKALDIVFGVDGHGTQIQVCRSAGDADGDLAAICNEQGSNVQGDSSGK